MEPTPLTLSSADQLLALRQLDIFHHWESIDERRYCRGCGQIITGRQIKVFGSLRSHHPSRLECPTEGCLSVPLEWIMLEVLVEPTAAQLAESLVPRPVARRPMRSDWQSPLHSSLFGFLRAPQVFV
jgi:hypothetical protein